MRTVEWDSGSVKMIDQRLLPTEFKIVTFTDVQGVARSIREMYVRGAPAIGATAAFGMALAATTSSASSVSELHADLEQAAAKLRVTRPTAVNLFWAIDRMLQRAQGPDLTSVGAIQAALE